MAVERKPSFGTPSRRYTTAAGDAILVTSPIQEPRPHTRLEDESGIEKKYVIGEELGKGAFGVVREIRDRRSGQQYAMKIVNKDKASLVPTVCLSLRTGVQVCFCFCFFYFFAKVISY